MIKMNNSGATGDRDVYASLALLLIAVFGFFYFAANYILYFQETQSLFLFTGEYFHQHLLKPGAPLEYFAKFLTQFYLFKIPGSLILSLILILPGIVMLRINKKMAHGKSYPLLIILIPSLLLVMLQANYYHLMEYNLGFVMILLYYLLLVSHGEKYRHTLVLILFPLFYFITGAYALVFFVMYIVHNLILENGRKKYTYSLLLLLIGVVTFFTFLKIIFLQPFEQLLLFPLPLLESRFYKIVFIVLGTFMILYPVSYRIPPLLKNRRLNTRIWNLVAIAAGFGVTILLLFKTFNTQTQRVVELQRLVFSGKWKDAVSYQEKHPSRNLIGQYFYNVALSETGELCDRLFSGNQDFGTGSLVLPWGDEHLNRGAYFYYSIGLINEAHRWAYEEMVVYGYRPQNIGLLTKTSLINGDYRMARKYLNILKRTMFYRNRAKEFEELADKPDLIKSHPELGAKLKILPVTNFFVEFNEPQNNLTFLLGSQPVNMKAFEYYIAWLLLSKDVEGVVNNIKLMKEMGYTRIPRHIEEAALIYYNSTGVFPDLGGLTVSMETRARFEKYFTAYVSARQNPSLLKQRMEKDFSNTFWYYFHFK